MRKRKIASKPSLRSTSPAFSRKISARLHESVQNEPTENSVYDFRARSLASHHAQFPQASTGMTALFQFNKALR